MAVNKAMAVKKAKKAVQTTNRKKAPSAPAPKNAKSRLGAKASKSTRPLRSARPVKKSNPNQSKTAGQAVLLSGGNPQIAKADGDGPVQTYIAAMPGWKRDVGRRLDALIVRHVPGVKKAVRWNSPFYGVEGQGWFVSWHCITKYVKVAFFQGASLRPLPPVESKMKDVRYLHIYEHDDLEEQLLASWIRQASELPGESCF